MWRDLKLGYMTRRVKVKFQKSRRLGRIYVTASIGDEFLNGMEIHSSPFQGSYFWSLMHGYN